MRGRAWSYLLHLSPRTRVLHVGSSEDAAGIAETAGHVTSVWPVGSPAAAAARARLARCRNVECATVDPEATRLPFDDGTFDLLAVWDLGQVLGRFKSARGVWRSDRALFDELRRLLAPQGELVVSFRRLNVRDRVRHPSIRSRHLARVLWALNRVGLRHDEVLRLHENGPRIYAAERAWSRGQWARLLRVALQAHAVSVIARAEGEESSCPPAFQSDGGPRSVGDNKARFSVYLGSFETDLIHLPDRTVRMAQSRPAIEQCERAFFALRTLQHLDLPFAVPAPVRAGRTDDARFYTETRVPGHALTCSELSPGRRASMAVPAIAALTAMQRSTKRRIEIDTLSFDQLFQVPIEELSPHLPNATATYLRRYIVRLGNRVMGRPVSLALVHGDFTIANVLWTRGQVSGVIDWDMSRLDGLCPIDYVTYRAFDDADLRGITIQQAMSERALPREDDHEYRRFCADEFGVDARLFGASVVMAIVLHALNRRHVTDELFGAWCRQNVVEPLERSCRDAIRLI